MLLLRNPSVRRFQAEPLKRLRRVAVHRYDVDVIQRDHFKVARELCNPARIVMSHGDTFRKIEYSVDSVLRFVANVPREISFIGLQPEIADVEKTTGSQHALQFSDYVSLPVIRRHTRENTEEQRAIDRIVSQRDSR